MVDMRTGARGYEALRHQSAACRSDLCWGHEANYNLNPPDGLRARAFGSQARHLTQHQRLMFQRTLNMGRVHIQL